MSDRRAGEGQQIIVRLMIDGKDVSTTIFGSKSGHPLSYDFDGSHAAQSVAAGRIYAACALAHWRLLNSDNLAAMDEFGEQLAQEQADREGFDLNAEPDDELGDIPF